LKELNIERVDILRDGGTIEIRCSNGQRYYIDGRIETKTPHMIYLSYPNDQNSPVEKTEAKKIKRNLLESLKEFGMQSDKYFRWYEEFKKIKVA